MHRTGRSEECLKLVEAYAKEQGLFHDVNTPAADYTDVLELDLDGVEPSLAGPSRPQDRVALKDMKKSFHEALPKLKTVAKKPALPMAGEPVPGPQPTLNGTSQRRLRGNRGNNQLYQYLEPLGDGGGRCPGQESRCAWADHQAVGQDKPCTGFQGGDRLPRRFQTDAGTGKAALLPRGLRLHNLYRQQWASRGGHFQGDQRRGLGSLCSPERQSKL